MLTPSEIWPMLVASAGIVFGAGRLSERMRNNKYVSKESCNKLHEDAEKLMNERFDHIKESLARIEARINIQEQNE